MSIRRVGFFGFGLKMFCPGRLGGKKLCFRRSTDTAVLMDAMKVRSSSRGQKLHANNGGFSWMNVCMSNDYENFGS